MACKSKNSFYCAKLHLLLFLAANCFLVSCASDDEAAFEPLLGTWNLKNGSGYSQESLTFRPDGAYEIINYSYFLTTFGNTPFEKVRLSGDYETDGQSIYFLSAEINFYEDAEVDRTLLATPGSAIGSFYGFDVVGVFADTNYVVKSILTDQNYQPVVWEILDLSDLQLLVKSGANTFEYERQN